MILGLDISTSMTGFCILDGEGEIIRSDVWDTRNKNKFKTFFDKIQYVKDGLQEIKVQYLYNLRQQMVMHIKYSL